MFKEILKHESTSDYRVFFAVGFFDFDSKLVGANKVRKKEA